MAETIVSDKVRLVNEGSVFTDEGTLVRIGEHGVVVGHRGFSDLVVFWEAMGTYGIAPRASVVVERR